MLVATDLAEAPDGTAHAEVASVNSLDMLATENDGGLWLTSGQFSREANQVKDRWTYVEAMRSCAFRLLKCVGLL